MKKSSGFMFYNKRHPFITGYFLFFFSVTNALAQNQIFKTVTDEAGKAFPGITCQALDRQVVILKQSSSIVEGGYWKL